MKKEQFNSERLKAFIAEHITANYEGNLVIMDNAGFHKAQDVKQEIQKQNGFLYSIPYYPRSNPIENFFSKLKYYIKKKSPLTYQQINKTIEDSISDMKEGEFKNYFSYAFDKEAVKKIYKRNSTLRRKQKIYLLFEIALVSKTFQHSKHCQLAIFESEQQVPQGLPTGRFLKTKEESLKFVQ